MKVHLKCVVQFNKVVYPKGIHEMPDELVNHWYLLALVKDGKAIVMEEKAVMMEQMPEKIDNDDAQKLVDSGEAEIPPEAIVPEEEVVPEDDNLSNEEPKKKGRKAKAQKGE